MRARGPGAARRRGARRERHVLGPNCMACAASRRSSTHIRSQCRAPRAGRAAEDRHAAQSGAVAAIMRLAFLAKGLGISFYISTGNEAI